MSFRAMILKRCGLAVVLVGAFVFPHASAQVAQVKDAPIAFVDRDAVLTTFVQPPNFGASDSASSYVPPSGDAGKWLKVEIHYGATSNVTKDYPFIDQVQFKVWIEGFDLYAKDAPAPGKGVSVTLTGDATYVNVGANRDLYAVFYVDPAVIARYSSERGSEEFTRKFNVHVEAYANGMLVDVIDKTKEDDPKWYAPLRAVPGLVSRQNQSPFVTSEVSRYPMLKPQTAAQ